MNMQRQTAKRPAQAGLFFGAVELVCGIESLSAKPQSRLFLRPEFS
jgi:hypothetical protein